MERVFARFSREYTGSILLISTVVVFMVGSCSSTPETAEEEPLVFPTEEAQAIMEDDDIAKEEAVAEAPAEPETSAAERVETKEEVRSEIETSIPVESAPLSDAVKSAKKFNHKILLLASEISTNLKEYDAELEAVVVTSMVDLDDLNSTNQFGRYVTERLIHEMHRSGFRVYEMRQGKSVEFVTNSGEFQLTREGKELLKSYSSDAVIVGTYSFVNGVLSLHTRMVEHETSRVISVASLDFDLNQDPYTKSLYKVTDLKKGVEMSLAPLGGGM